jgi:hypothetical protein
MYEIIIIHGIYIFTNTCTGQKEITTPAWPLPVSMTEVVPDADQIRIEKISKDLADMTKEERIQFRHQFLVKICKPYKCICKCIMYHK